VKFGASNFTVKLCSLFVGSIGRERFKLGTSPVYMVALTFNMKRTLAVVLWLTSLANALLYKVWHGRGPFFSKKNRTKKEEKPMQPKV